MLILSILYPLLNVLPREEINPVKQTKIALFRIFFLFASVMSMQFRRFTYAVFCLSIYCL